MNETIVIRSFWFHLQIARIYLIQDNSSDLEI